MHAVKPTTDKVPDMVRLNGFELLIKVHTTSDAWYDRVCLTTMSLLSHIRHMAYQVCLADGAAGLGLSQPASFLHTPELLSGYSYLGTLHRYLDTPTLLYGHSYTTIWTDYSTAVLAFPPPASFCLLSCCCRVAMSPRECDSPFFPYKYNE